MLPSYLEKLTVSDLKERSAQLSERVKNCNICPNNCEINRLKNETGQCNSEDEILISSYGPHFGEEPPLVGSFGSGTIFFTNCNMSCLFCQNYDISHLRRGDIVNKSQLAGIMLQLQSEGCHNINLVSPTHFISQIVESLLIAVEKGLEIPIVYNCGGYESVDTLKLLEGIVDIYMPDVKYSSDEIAKQLSGVDEYWSIVTAAVKEMYRQVGDLHIKRSGVATRGLLIRHLILPNDLAGSEQVIEFIANEVSKSTYLNIMDQYHPVYKANTIMKLNRPITRSEYEKVQNYAKQLGLGSPGLPG